MFSIDKKFSEPANVSCDVLQESILGALLSLLHLNGMPQAVKFDLSHYANGTCLTLQHENMKEV